jgi:hypothetical protein
MNNSEIVSFINVDEMISSNDYSVDCLPLSFHYKQDIDRILIPRGLLRDR